METNGQQRSLERRVADTIAVKRLVRNLQYRLTYLHILDTYLDSDLEPILVQLLMSLMEIQRSAIALLMSYLGSLGLDTQDQAMNRKLVEHASKRHDIEDQLRFVRYGLSRSISWYHMQLVDRQMTADPDLLQMLTALGEAEAAALWRTETVMAMLGIPPQPAPENQPVPGRRRIRRAHDWHSGLLADVAHPSWNSSHSLALSSASRSGFRKSTGWMSKLGANQNHQR